VGRAVGSIVVRGVGAGVCVANEVASGVAVGAVVGMGVAAALGPDDARPNAPRDDVRASPEVLHPRPTTSDTATTETMPTERRRSAVRKGHRRPVDDGRAFTFGDETVDEGFGQ